MMVRFSCMIYCIFFLGKASKLFQPLQFGIYFTSLGAEKVTYVYHSASHLYGEMGDQQSHAGAVCGKLKALLSAPERNLE